MSHIATIDLVIKDLDALKAACKELGAIFVEGQRTYTWFGRSVGDYPLPAGMKIENLGKCSHAIKLPGVNYEVGVVKKADGSYTLAYDFFGSGDQHDGQKLQQHFGNGLVKIKQYYGVCKAEMAARAKGYMVSKKKLADGTIKLQVTGV